MTERNVVELPEDPGSNVKCVRTGKVYEHVQDGFYCSSPWLRYTWAEVLSKCPDGVEVLKTPQKFLTGSKLTSAEDVRDLYSQERYATAILRGVSRNGKLGNAVFHYGVEWGIPVIMGVTPGAKSENGVPGTYCYHADAVGLVVDWTLTVLRTSI